MVAESPSTVTVPDPSDRTMLEITRSESSTDKHIRDLVEGCTNVFESELKGIRETFDAKLKGTDDSCNQQFSAVGHRLTQAEEQRKELKADADATRLETKQDTTKALEAALVAAKDQVAAQAESFAREFIKSEQQTSDKITALGATTSTQIGVLSDSVSKIEVAVAEIVSAGLGRAEQKGETRQMTASTIGFIVFGITVIMFLIGILGFMATTGPQPAG